jgi:hypothetical protein
VAAKKTARRRLSTTADVTPEPTNNEGEGELGAAVPAKPTGSAMEALLQTQPSAPTSAFSSQAPQSQLSILPEGQESTGMDATMGKESEQMATDPSASLAPTNSVFKDFKCVVCLDGVIDATATFCGHVFCEACIMASIESNQRCPTCRCKLSLKEIHPLFV